MTVGDVVELAADHPLSTLLIVALTVALIALDRMRRDRDRKQRLADLLELEIQSRRGGFRAHRTTTVTVSEEIGAEWWGPPPPASAQLPALGPSPTRQLLSGPRRAITSGGTRYEGVLYPDDPTGR